MRQEIYQNFQDKDNNDRLRRGLNYLIKQGLGDEYKSVTDLAEALIILNINTIP
jgi:hypothetical protein